MSLRLDPEFARLLAAGKPRAAEARRQALFTPIQRRSQALGRIIASDPSLTRGIPQAGAIRQEFTVVQKKLQRRGMNLDDPRVIERAIATAVRRNIRKRTERPMFAKVISGLPVFLGPLALAAAPLTVAGLAAFALQQGTTIANTILEARGKRFRL